VKIAWASVDEFLDELWDVGAGSPFCREVADLLFAGNLTSEEKPEETYLKSIRHCDVDPVYFCTFG